MGKMFTKVLQSTVRQPSALRSRVGFGRMSVSTRVALGVALPTLLVLISLSLVHSLYRQDIMEDQLRLTALQLGEVMLGSLRHAMLVNDGRGISQTMADIGRMATAQQVQIIGLDDRVVADSGLGTVGMIRRLDDPGCVECHQFPAGSRPRTTRLSTSAGVLRISTPIQNEPECSACHKQQGRHLGVLLTDVSVANVEERVRSNFRLDLAISIGGTVLVTLGMYWLIHRLVVRRVQIFRRPLDEFAAGDFTSRLPPSPAPTDELGDLANAFNHMADELQRHIREREEREQLRQRAIVEERERIARELHDGLAQLLGYVNTKAMAARLMLRNCQAEAADQHLLQLEEAARELSTDVREAILSLRMAGRHNANLVAMLGDFTAQFSRLSNLPVDLTFSPAVERLPLPAEHSLQLLRIAQEALVNIRKHASATHGWVSLRVSNGILELTVDDNGQGLAPDAAQAGHQPHFGLSTMRERAQAIGAAFHMDSGSGGTRITVQLPLKDVPGAQSKEG
jgi:signal transduction histidine kinase